MFDNASALRFLRVRCSSECLAAYKRVIDPAQKADLFRLAYLFHEGGVFADVDNLCRRPLAPLLFRFGDLGLYQENYGTTGNDFIAARPANPIIGAALAEAVAAINAGDRDIVWLQTGPGLLTRTAAHAYAVSGGLSAAELQIIDRMEFQHYVARSLQAVYKRSKRHWLRR